MNVPARFVAVNRRKKRIFGRRLQHLYTTDRVAIPAQKKSGSPQRAAQNFQPASSRRDLEAKFRRFFTTGNSTQALEDLAIDVVGDALSRTVGHAELSQTNVAAGRCPQAPLPVLVRDRTCR